MADTLNRAYPRPDPSRTIAEEFPVSDQALVAIDADIHELFEAILGLAPTNHTHDLADVEGLIDALAGKAALNHAHALDDLDDVSGAAGAANGYVLVKSAAGWIPGSPASVIGAHQHAITDVVNLYAALTGLALASQINGGTDEAFADTSMLVARKADGSLIKRSWANVKEAIRAALGSMVSASTAKSTPVDADQLLLSDSAASNAPAKLSWLNVKAALKTYFDTLYLLAANIAQPANYLANTASKVLTTDKVWAAAAYQDIGQTLNGNVNLDFGTFINGYGSATGNITFNSFSNYKQQVGVIAIWNGGAAKTVSVNTTPFRAVGTLTLDPGINYFSYFPRWSDGLLVITQVAKGVP